MSDFFANAFSDISGAFKSVDDWFGNVGSFIDSSKVLQTGAKAVSQYIQANEKESQSLLDRVTGVTSKEHSNQSNINYQAQRVQMQGSEDFYTWERRWMDRLQRFYNPAATEVRLPK